MTISSPIATVFGGTGFVGSQVVRELAKRGYTVKVATRVPESAFFLRPAGTVGQVVPFACNYDDAASITRAVENADVVVNCIGILFERRKGQFKKIHAELPAVIANECLRAGVKRFVHISALGCDTGTSEYARTKREGEAGVQSNFPAATILRPSIIFGEDDDFFNRFARLSQILPAMLLIGGGQTKFQPVYVGDVADAVMAAIENPEAPGRIYELGGPEVVTFKQVYDMLFRYTGQKRCLVNLPFGFAKVKASFFELMPTPILTRDQVESLKTDSVAGGALPGLADLGIQPTAMEIILPKYLELYRAGGRFAAKNAA